MSGPASLMVVSPVRRCERRCRHSGVPVRYGMNSVAPDRYVTTNQGGASACRSRMRGRGAVGLGGSCSPSTGMPCWCVRSRYWSWSNDDDLRPSEGLYEVRPLLGSAAALLEGAVDPPGDLDRPGGEEDPEGDDPEASPVEVQHAPFAELVGFVVRGKLGV